MALTEKMNAENYAAIGTPASDTVWAPLVFGFKSEGLKFTVAAGVLDISMNGKDLYFILDSAVAKQFDFTNMHIPRIWVRNTSAVGVQILAWSGE